MSNGQFNAVAAQSNRYPNGTPEVAPNHPIPLALGQLSSAINEMGIMSETLANRLSMVLMPSSAQATGRAETLAAAPPPTSQQAEEIHAYRRRVENITAQLQDVLNRLEV